MKLMKMNNCLWKCLDLSDESLIVFKDLNLCFNTGF